MSLWKIKGRKLSKIAQTRFSEEKLLEAHLEDWIGEDPSILGEPLLIIGRQVLVQDTKDRLDLLAVDPHGNTVIIELKRGGLKDPVDIQALRYASYISKWTFEDLEAVARNYFRKVGDQDFNFNAMFESFCERLGVEEEVPAWNQSQRLIIVGSYTRDKLASVAVWLRDHGIDIKVVEVHAFKEGDSILVQPSVVVPLPVGRGGEVGRVRRESAPWMVDGRTWHLEKRCSPTTREWVLELDTALERFDLDGPRWNQKHYVAYRVHNHNWLYVNTRARSLFLDFMVKADTFTSKGIAKQLGIKVFDKEDSLSEKLNLPSSVFVKNRSNNTQRVRIRIKKGFDLKAKAFQRFLEAAYRAAAAQQTTRTLQVE